MHEDRPSLPAPTPSQRTGFGLAATCLLFLCIWVLQTAHHFLGRLNSNRPREASTLQSHLFEWFILTACGEILLAFAIFCLLVIYWSIAAPPWATRAFNFVGGHVWHVLILVIAGFFLVGAFVAMNHG